MSVPGTRQQPQVLTVQEALEPSHDLQLEATQRLLGSQPREGNVGVPGIASASATSG